MLRACFHRYQYDSVVKDQNGLEFNLEQISLPLYLRL